MQKTKMLHHGRLFLRRYQWFPPYCHQGPAYGLALLQELRSQNLGEMEGVIPIPIYIKASITI